MAVKFHENRAFSNRYCRNCEYPRLYQFFHETLRSSLTLLPYGEYSLTSLNVYAGRKVGAARA
jgi:hypothetical protein